MTTLHDESVIDLVSAVRSGDRSASEITAHYLARIARLDAALGAFVTVTDAAARQRAAGPLPENSALTGVPFADKDLVARRGVPTMYGSRAFADYEPDASDPLAEGLDAAGGISLGKTSTPEFGLTGYTESRVSAPARNPWNPSTNAGGSSGGAAVAVAAGLLPWAPASDGGGSIRIPAATCGVVGLKPSRGRLPIGSGLDSADGLAVNGPIARSVADAGYLLDVLAGLAPYPYAVAAAGERPLGPHAFAQAATTPPESMRVGVTYATPWDDDTEIALDPAARIAVQWAADTLASASHAVADATWRPVGYPALFRTLWRASAARIPLSADADVEPITSWLMREGRALSSSDVLTAFAAARAFETATIANFASYDAVLTPALAQSPRPNGWFDAQDPERNFTQQVQYAPHTSWVNVAGLPAITVPVVMAEDARPVSVQLVGRSGGEAAILALAAVLEHARGPLPHPPAWFA